MKIKLTEITVAYDGKNIKFTIEEAKELYKQLHELFGDKTVYVPSSPIIIERDRWPYWYHEQITPYTTSYTDKTEEPKMTVWCKTDNNAIT